MRTRPNRLISSRKTWRRLISLRNPWRAPAPIPPAKSCWPMAIRWRGILSAVIATRSSWTPGAGKLRIPRHALQTLAFNPRSPMLFDGPTSIDGWTQGHAVTGIIGESGQWTYRNGAFYADKAASIAREVNLPDRSQVQFDLAWKGPLNLAIALYTDSLQPILLVDKEHGPDFGGFYSLRFASTVFITLEPIRKQDTR